MDFFVVKYKRYMKYKKRGSAMIFYFSGTGNSAWAARRLAFLTDDEAYDITALSMQPNLENARQIGFVFPVYAWGAPEVMTAFAKKLAKSHIFTFGVCTCGGEAGLAMKAFSKCYHLDSSYSLIMPNNYIVGMDTDDEEEIVRKLARAREELQKISGEILKREQVYRVYEGNLAGLKSSVANFGFNKFARSAKPFRVTDDCSSCGMCAAKCPVSAISLKDGKPVWKTQCCQCMRCINECPRQAIQYGKFTAGRRRYTIQKYLPQDEQF